MLFHRQEGHAHAIGSGSGQFESEAGAFAREEFVGDLNEDACAVTSFGIASTGTPVGEVDQYLDSFADDVVILLAPYVGDKANATGVMLVPRIVQTLGWRQTIRSLYSLRFHRSNAQFPRRWTSRPTARKLSVTAMEAQRIKR